MSKFRGRGLLLTLASLVIHYLINQDSGGRLVTPAYFYLMPVVYSAISENLGFSLGCASLGVLYSMFFYSSAQAGFGLRYNHDDIIRLIDLSVSTYGIVFMVGWLKKRNDRIMADNIQVINEGLKQSKSLEEAENALAIRQEKLWKTAAERAEQQQNFLAKAGQILASDLDYEVTLNKIVKLAVPHLADWAVVDIFNEERELKRLAIAHQDPEKIIWAQQLQKKYPDDLSGEGGLGKVLRDGVPILHPSITDEMLLATAKDSEHLRMLKEVGMTSVMIVPLKNFGKILGSITFVSTKPEKNYNKQDLSMAQELAGRASLAIHNAQLYKQARYAADKEHQQAELLNTILHNAPIGFAFLNTNLEFLVVNHVLANLGGLPIESHLGKKIFDIFPNYQNQMQPHFEHVLQTNSPVINFEASGDTPAEPGKIRHWYTSYYPVKDSKNELTGIGMIVQEITQQRQAEAEIYHSAYHDPLTGLPNRKAFEEQLLKILHAAKSAQKKFAVMFLDIDHLKDINDGLGHDMGDAVLREISQRLRNLLRSDDVVARWGGDEFVILLPEVFGDADACRVAEKILAGLEPVMLIKNHNLHISASIGIALFPIDGEDARSLQKNADTALYRAKDSGRNRYELYTQAMNIKAGERLALEHDLRQALGKKEMFLCYQPVLDLKTREIKSVEALLRWRHPRLGTLHPGKFLSIAEDLGLIVSLGRWVAAKTARTLYDLQSQNIFLQAAINVSALQFSDESLVDNILRATDSAHIAPACLEIEVTESLAMENLDRTKAKLMQLREKNITITVDDFGTGYSSLNYLKRLPIDKIKIDKSFVRNMITDEHDTSIIKAIISMAQSLHLKVIAEGVDTEMQLNLLASLGCDAAQGYFISKPLMKKELIEFLSNKKPQQLKVNADPLMVSGSTDTY